MPCSATLRAASLFSMRTSSLKPVKMPPRVSNLFNLEESDEE